MIVKNSLEKHIWRDGKKPQGMTIKALLLTDEGVHTFHGAYARKVRSDTHVMNMNNMNNVVFIIWLQV